MTGTMSEAIVEKNIRILPFNGNEQVWHEWSAKFLARADMLGYLQALTEDDTGRHHQKQELSDGLGPETDCNKMAYNQLILCCEGRAFSIVHNAKSERYPRGDAALAWKNLKKRFQVETAAGKMELKLKFSSLKLLGGQDPDEWLLELDLLRIRLDEMGSPVTEEDLIAHVLNNLTPEYSELITSLEGTLESLVVETLKERILSFYRRKLTGEYANLNQMHMHNENKYPKTHRGLTQGNKRAWRPEKGQCYWCLRKGHVVKDCERRLSGENSAKRPDGTHYNGNLQKGNQNNRKNEKSHYSFTSSSFYVGANDGKVTSKSKEHLTRKQRTENAVIESNSTRDYIESNVSEIGMWLIDSGCNRHISPYRDEFKNMRETDVTCTFGNNGQIKAKGIGEVEFQVLGKGETDSKPNVIHLTLKDVLYVPEASTRLLSSGCLRRSGGKFVESYPESTLCFAGGNASVPLIENGRFLWLKQHTANEMSHIRTVYAPGGREAASASLLDWLELLGHSHPSSILYLGQKGCIHITGQKDLNKFNCRLCKECKSTVPHYQRGTRSPKQPGECIHIDLVGPFTPDFEGHTYMVVTIDEATRFKRSYGIRNRAEAHIILKQLRDDYVTDGVTIITVRGDSAGELGRSTYFKKALGNLGIKWESAPPYTHQQHGLAERAVRQITEGGRVQLARAHLGDDFWLSACQDFTMKSNILPHQALGDDTPYERLHHERQPRYQGLRKFGQTAYVHIDKNRKGEFSRGIRSKMRPRAEKGNIIRLFTRGGSLQGIFANIQEICNIQCGYI